MDHPVRPKRERPYFFEFNREIGAFDEAVNSALGKVETALVRQYLSEENTHRFKHGGAWTMKTNVSPDETEMRKMTAEVEIRHADIIDNNLTVIPKFFASVSEDLHRQFAEMLYSTVSAACDRTGNVVDAKKVGSLASTFLEMLERVEFDVDRNGQVSLPALHARPETADKMLRELYAQPPEFAERVERLKAEKTQAALQRESQRKARFKRYGG